MDFTKMYCSFRDATATESGSRPVTAKDGKDTSISVGQMNNAIEIQMDQDLIGKNFATLHHAQFKPPTMMLQLPGLQSTNGTNNYGNGQTIVQKIHNHSSRRKYGQALSTFGHAVFLCQLCAQAHRKLPLEVTIVKNVTLDTWTMKQVNAIMQSNIGGNTYALDVMEHYMHQGNCHELKPNAHSSIQTREIFSRAKYQVLAFLLPNGPLAMKTSFSLSALGTPSRKRAIAKNNSSRNSSNSSNGNKYVEQELPNRLVDYFCIVSPDGTLEPANNQNKKLDLSSYRSPSELRYETHITDCFPSKEAHGNPKLFPALLKKFVFPQGCRPTKQQAPTLFTFTLTNEAGTKMYGAALHIFDTHMDLDQIYRSIEKSGYKGKLPPWLSNYPHPNSSSSLNKIDPKHKHGPSKATELSGNDSDMFFLPKSLVVLSHYAFFDIWRRFLLQIYHISIVRAPLPIERYITNFVCEVPLPPMGKVAVKVKLTNDDVLSISRPPDNRLPLLNCSLRPLFASLSVSNVMVLMGCLLQETRVALCSKHLALLGPCCETLVALLFPFAYEGIYIPCLPDSLTVDLLEAPIPFLVGIHRAYLDEFPLEMRPLGVVFVDLDNDVVHLGYDENDHERSEGRLPPLLPERDAMKLKLQLEECAGFDFVPPGIGRKGQITYGLGDMLPNEKRPAYCRMAYAESSLVSRSEFLAEVEMAFLEADLMPIDFAGGTLTNTNDSKESNEFKMKGVRKVKKTSADRIGASTGTLERPKHLLDLDSSSDKFDGNEIRNAFLRFLVTFFVDYEKYLNKSGNSEQFHKEKFISSLGAEAKSFMSEVVDSQMFQRFIEEKIYNPYASGVKFFDDSIIAKKNRSKSSMRRRKETKFINDESGKIVETFVPPDVNNAGISETSFHYTKFPESLDRSFIGPIRKPKVLGDQGRQGKMLTTSMQKSSRSQQKVLADLLKPLSLSETEPETYVEKDVNWALHAIAFHENNIGEGESLAGLLSPSLLSKAESIIARTRERQIISVANLITVQRFWISHRVFPKYQSDKNAGPRNKVSRDTWMRPGVVKTSWSKLKNGITMIQSRYRVFRFRQRYLCIRILVSKIQGLVRGFLTRSRVRQTMTSRAAAYNSQILALWSRSFVSLFYRSRFTLLNDFPAFLGHKLLENELSDLYARLGISLLEADEDEYDVFFAKSAIHATFQRLKPLLEKPAGNEPLFPAELTTKSELAIRLLEASRRIGLERVQIYERLQSFSRTDEIYGIFKVSNNSKMKKANVASMVWSDGSDGRSSNAMCILFPELGRSSNVAAVSPSKKSFKRVGIGARGGIPPPVHRSIDLEYKLDNLIRTNLAIVAKGLLAAPSHLKRSQKKSQTARRTNASMTTDTLRAFVNGPSGV